jgi:hypothetical protein
VAAIAQTRTANSTECTAIRHRRYRGARGAIAGCRGNNHGGALALSARGYSAHVDRDHGTGFSARDYSADVDTDDGTGVSPRGCSANFGRNHGIRAGTTGYSADLDTDYGIRGSATPYRR